MDIKCKGLTREMHGKKALLQAARVGRLHILKETLTEAIAARQRSCRRSRRKARDRLKIPPEKIGM
jgi:polyribonucleotide nucleotidyltransferase